MATNSMWRGGVGPTYRRRFGCVKYYLTAIVKARLTTERSPMAASGVPPLGQRIRAERLRRELSLRALARDVGVSASMISQIETGKAQPSVSTLYAITSILGLSIQDRFETPDGARVQPY